MEELEIVLECEDDSEGTIILENEDIIINKKIDLQEKIVTPTKEEQTINFDEKYDGLSSVIVNSIPEEYIIPEGTLDIIENGSKDVTKYSNVNVNVEPSLQSKEITPTKEIQNVIADQEYDGLKNVSVNPIPDEYIIPTGILNITENGTHDVRLFSRVSAAVYPTPNLQDKSITITENGTTNIVADSGYNGLNNVEVITNVASSGGGDAPEKGFIINEWSSTGYPSDITVIGMDYIPKYYLYGLSVGKNLENVKIENVITSIGEYAFKSCTTLKKVEFAKGSTINFGQYAFADCSNLENINFEDIQFHTNSKKNVFQNCSSLLMDKFPQGLVVQYSSYDYMFDGCSKINFKTLPDGIIALNGYCMFAKCVSLVQLSMNLQTITGNAYNNSPFKDCTGLKALWIGSKMSTSGFAQYAFAGCTGVKKMFIDKPRATVEVMTNYSTKFGATNSTIICNDDEGFITRAEFDAIDWSTY